MLASTSRTRSDSSMCSLTYFLFTSKNNVNFNYVSSITYGCLSDAGLPARQADLVNSKAGAFAMSKSNDNIVVCAFISAASCRSG
jgi:hypothetical protein